MLEAVDSDLTEFLRPGNVPHTDRLMELRTLVMPETGDPHSDQIAKVGNIISLSRAGGGYGGTYRYRFVPNPVISPIPSDAIERAADHLGISAWD